MKTRFPISLKIALMVIVFIFITMAFTTFFRIRKDESFLEGLFVERTERVAKMVAAIRSVQPAGEEQVDWLLFQDYIDTIINYFNDIIYIAITNSQNSIKAFTASDIVQLSDERGNPILNIEPQLLINALEERQADVSIDYKIIKVNVTDFDTVLGTVSICYSKIQINHQRYETRVRTILLSVVMVLLGIVISFFYSRQFTRNIAILTNAVNEISSGRFPDAISVGSKDEIGILADNFNIMNKGLYHKSLIESFSYQISQRKGLQGILDLTLEKVAALQQVRKCAILYQDTDGFFYVTRSFATRIPMARPATPFHVQGAGYGRVADWHNRPITLNAFANGLIFPVETRERVVAYLVVAPKTHFDKDDISLFRSLCLRLSMAIENDRLNQTILKQEVYKRELEIASRVQRRLLPKQEPRLAGLDVASRLITAREVGGDYYDLITLDDHRLFVLISDVSGKGTSASFYMALLKGVVVTLTAQAFAPEHILRQLNEVFYTHTPKDIFVSMIFGVLDTRAATFSYIRAGHCPVLYYTAQDNQVMELVPPGMAVGAVDNQQYHNTFRLDTISLRGGDCLLLYTDGVTEAMNQALEEYGSARLQECFFRRCRQEAAAIINGIYSDISRFRGGYAQSDDIAMVCLRIR